MNYVWRNGAFATTDLDLEDSDGGDWGAMLKRAGFGAYLEYGAEEPEHVWSAEVYYREGEGAREGPFAVAEYIVCFSVGNTYKTILVEDFPGLLELLRHIAPVVQVGIETDRAQVLNNHMKSCDFWGDGLTCPHCRQELALTGELQRRIQQRRDEDARRRREAKQQAAKA